MKTGTIQTRGSVESPVGRNIAVAAGNFTQAASGAPTVSAPTQGDTLQLKARQHVALGGRVDASPPQM